MKRETSTTTKLRIVFDASAKPSEESPSLNECLETGPPLQNLLWNVLVRNRVKPVALTVDIKQAFLQVRIRAEDRDVLRFYWIKNKDPSTIEVFYASALWVGTITLLTSRNLEITLGELKNKVPHRS